MNVSAQPIDLGGKNMRAKKQLRRVVVLAALSVAVSSYARATTVVFPDPGAGNYNFSPAASYDGVTFAANFPAISGVGSSIGADQVNFFDDTFGGFIDMTFAAANSFSAVVSQGYPGTSGSISIEALDGSTVVYSSTPTVGGQDSFTLFSITGVGPFTEVEVSTAGSPQFPGIAQIQVGFASAVPEPSTWAMMLLGFVSIGCTGYRRSRKASAARVAA
jgi:hypothetical protein